MDNPTESTVGTSTSATCYPLGTILEPCVMCEGTGRFNNIECPGCKLAYVMPVGINDRQLEAMRVDANKYREAARKTKEFLESGESP